jgi:SAM-dependent methyltransferase
MRRTGPTIETALRSRIWDYRPWCLNLGCGANIEATNDDGVWYNLDMEKHSRVDVVWNLEKTPLPFNNDYFDFIKASHVLEHVRNWTQLMRDLYRILKPRGVLHIKVPDGKCWAAMADPTHVNLFAPQSWLHWDKDIYLGFETLKTSRVGYKLQWLEVVSHNKPPIDDGVPGNYFTEHIVDLEKKGDFYPWEKHLLKLTEGEQCQRF